MAEIGRLRTLILTLTVHGWIGRWLPTEFERLEFSQLQPTKVSVSTFSGRTRITPDVFPRTRKDGIVVKRYFQQTFTDDRSAPRSGQFDLWKFPATPEIVPLGLGGRRAFDVDVLKVPVIR